MLDRDEAGLHNQGKRVVRQQERLEVLDIERAPLPEIALTRKPASV